MAAIESCNVGLKSDLFSGISLYEQLILYQKRYYFNWWTHTFVEKRSDRCFCWFSVAMLVPIRMDISGCENCRFSSLLAAWDVSRGGIRTSSIQRQRQKFHTDDVNQCLHNKSGSYGFQMQILFNFAFLLVHFGRCCVHLPTSSSKTQMLLLGKNIFHKYWLFCYRFTAFTFDLCVLLAFVCHS